MKIIAEICVIPIGNSVSLSKEVSLAHQILKDTGLPVQLHSYGTNIEGDYDVVMAAVKAIHQALHAKGLQRLHTSIKIGSRIDKQQNLDDKIKAVHKQLNLTSGAHKDP